ncbi:MAG: bifunctional diaminohydroxyphosphoribosylaminopyrimidine deaminase/5-amino-6-(5-phosphoribosylamino)uracil reductase RibD [Deltaproteobacteria bacterium]|nr:bifunctional diaminohydroxyphosphoribosylaminopyrimidine deaminase/5-amino-6-(5-phosphoribosylamino)uracil reductase RibD [Deltaproteobacteria bacterium]
MSPERWMGRCLTLARQAEGRTAPNPMVGCVIVNDAGETLAEGHHVAPGRDHAEVDALNKLPERRAPGATMIVNLEPCNHHGRTPPCTDAVLRSGVRRVIVGMVDPNPIVAGTGLDRLRAAGVEVILGVEEAACRALNAPYLLALAERRPWVTVKAAVSLDGRVADAFGRSQWITGEAARLEGHRLRNLHDAVMVGSGTLLADDPSLNTRLDGGRDALPVLVDTQLRVTPEARVMSAGRRPVVICAEDAPDRVLPAEVVRVPRAEGGVDLRAGLTALTARGVHSVLVEGGAKLNRALFSAGLVDRLCLFVAPKVLAGGLGFVGGAPLPLEGAFGLRHVSARPVGDELLVVLERA